MTRDAAGEVRGVAADVGREFAAYLGVAFEPIVFPTVAKLVEEGKTGGWDVTFLTPDPARAGDMEFIAPLLDVEVSYLVSATSPIKSVSNADQPGHRIAVIQRSAPDLFLSRNLKQAQVVRTTGGPTAAFELLASGKADAFAENRHMLLALSGKLQGSRVLEDRVFVQQIALAVPKGRSSASQYARTFIERAKATGVVQQSIDRAGLRGVTVAPSTVIN
jgi:polar amino acid transport system substrate-binding protein